MNKKILIIIVVVCLIIAIGIGIIWYTSRGKNNTKSDVAYIQKFNTIELTDTLQQVNQKIGFEGTLRNASLGAYSWNFSDNTGIEVYFNSSTNQISDTKLLYATEDIINSAVKIPNLTLLQSKIDKGISYEEIKKECGNVDGVLIRKSPTSSEYRWQKEVGKYLNATFNSQNVCTAFNGRG